MQNSEEKKIAYKEKIVSFINDQLTCDFVGEKKCPYYKRKWESIANRKFFARINWSALILGPIWYAYRKMYLCLFVFIAILIVTGMIEAYFEINIPSIIFSIALGMFANDLYLWHARRKISKLKAEVKDESSLRNAVKRKGGVSVLAGTLITAIYLIMFVVIIIEFATHHHA